MASKRIQSAPQFPVESSSHRIDLAPKASQFRSLRRLPCRRSCGIGRAFRAVVHIGVQIHKGLDIVQLKTFWTAVRPPVPPVKPTKAVFPPTMLGMLIAWLVVNVFAAFVVSVIVIVKVVPSYVM